MTRLEQIEKELKKLSHKVNCGTQFFETTEEFPEVGKECAIYVDKSTGALYVYDKETATYITTDAGEDAEFTLTTTGTSGPATLIGDTLNIPQYQAELTFDSTPTDGSSNPVTSNGVFDSLALKQDKFITTTGTLTTAGWSLVSGLYEQSVSDANITASSLVDIIPNNADIDIVTAAQILPRTDSAAGSVKVYAKNLPTANIGITLNIWK